MIVGVWMQWEPAVVWMVVSGHGTSPQENVSGVLTEVQWMCGHSPSPLTHRNQQCYRGNQR
ncbi:hypothetical protein GBAR_LOCUS20667 [Geodia barretti]|uniref:Uncharacterized protein n=1 Tax=Geodia barretti TaxID=519541 RepID=A0AA35X1X2_GEOBA|nr:hypothetical protein GBAR_LOCUS20667 [Geodia barretti]